MGIFSSDLMVFIDVYQCCGVWASLMLSVFLLFYYLTFLLADLIVTLPRRSDNKDSNVFYQFVQYLVYVGTMPQPHQD